MLNGQSRGSLGGRIEYSPQRKKRMKATRQRQEDYWARKRPSWEQPTPGPAEEEQPSPDSLS